MNSAAKIYIAGHRGMVGSAILNSLNNLGYQHILTRTHQELDLTNQRAVEYFFKCEKPDFVFLAAAKVGGIIANSTYPAQFIRENLAIQTNVIHASYQQNVKRLLFLGSSCIYPKFAPQPIKEEYLLTSELEPTNRSYAVAKIAGVEMCWSYNRQYGTRYIAAMPTNLFGLGDNYHLQNSHVIPAMIRKLHLAKLALKGDIQNILQDERIHGPITPDIREMIGLTQLGMLDKNSTFFVEKKITLWGTGSPRREFLFSNDLGRACVHIMNLPNCEFDKLIYKDATSQQNYHSPPLVNIGMGRDISIKQLAMAVAKIVGYEGKIEWDATKPDGTPQKLMDSSKIEATGWRYMTELEYGLEMAYTDYQNRITSLL